MIMLSEPIVNHNISVVFKFVCDFLSFEVGNSVSNAGEKINQGFFKYVNLMHYSTCNLSNISLVLRLFKILQNTKKVKGAGL